MPLIPIDEEPHSGLIPLDAKPATSIFAPEEVLMNLLSGAVAAPIGVAAGLGTAVGRGLGVTQQSPLNVAGRTSEAITYQPKGDIAKKVSGAIAWPFEKIGEGLHWIGEKTGEMTGSPLAGEITELGLQAGLMAAPFIRGGPNAKKIADGIKKEPTGLIPEAAPIPPENLITPPKPRYTLKEGKPVLIDDQNIVGNINLDYVNASDQIKSVIGNTAAAYKGRMDEARRGEITNEVTRSTAEFLGMTPETLLKRKKGEAFNAETLLASRDLLNKSATELHELAKAAIGPDASDAALAAFQSRLNLHVAIQEQVSGAIAEAGRALQQQKILSSGDKAKAIKNILEQRGRTRIQEIAEAAAQLDTPEQISKFAKQVTTPTFSDKFIFAWINSLLSGPQTHSVNIVSGGLTTMLQTGERAIAAGIGKLHGGEKVFFREVPAEINGMVQGTIDGMHAFGKAFKTGEPSDLYSKLEMRHQNAIGGKAGQIIGLPGRLLTAEDEFVKAIAYRMELNALATRKAIQEGTKDIGARSKELMDNPPQDLIDASVSRARYSTFTKPLGQMGVTGSLFVNSHPLAKMIVPFIRTPTNILKFAGERTPLAVLSKNVRADLAAGGARRDMAIARLTMGSGIGATVITAASEDLITGGGPPDPDQRRSQRDAGWQPYSIKVGDTYYAYNRLEPVGMLVGLSADMYEINQYMTEDEREKLSGMIVGSVARNLTNKTFLQGITNAVNALTDPDRYGEKWMLGLAGTIIPTGVAQAQRQVDPVLREAHTMIDKIKSRIPGMSEGLLPRRNAWGDPIVLEGGLGPDILSPVYTSKIKDDPVYQEVVRLKLDISMPKKRVHDVPLTPEEYDQYIVMSGQLAKIIAGKIVVSDSYKAMHDFQKKEVLKEVIKNSREAATAQMLGIIGGERLIEQIRKKAK